jgi:serine/threonine protein kinase
MEAAHHVALPPGCRIEEYRIISVLGEGSFGITYLAEDVNLGARLAIKEYLPSDWAFRDSTQTVRPKSSHLSKNFEVGQDAFLNEARLLACVAHPNVVKVRRYFRGHGTAYIAMDFIEGRTLGDTLTERYGAGGYPSAALKQLLVAVLDGLGALHNAGIIHRDIKPANIVIQPNGNPVLVDFGAARNFDRQGMTVIVTHGYAPIEQYSDDGKQGPFTDIYALGALAYRAIAGEPPEAPYKRLGRDTAQTASIAGAGKYPRELLSAIDWALAVRPEDRPATAAALLARLRNVPEVTRPVRASAAVVDEPTLIMDATRWQGRGHQNEHAPREPFLALSGDVATADHRSALSASAPPSWSRPERRTTVILITVVLVAIALASTAVYVIAPLLLGGPSSSVSSDEQERLRAAEAERQAEVAAKQKADEEALRQVLEAAKLKAAQDAAVAAEGRRQAAESAKRKAERDAAAAAEAQRQAAAKQKADQDAAAEAQRQAGEAARLRAEQEAAVAAQAQRQAAEAAQKAEQDQRDAAERAAAEAQRNAAQPAPTPAPAADAVTPLSAPALKSAQAVPATRKPKPDTAEKRTTPHADDARCTTILQSSQLMGEISDEDRAYLRDHCH